ncbi:MAG TPA: hypothetical protein VK897_04645 [Anaerolineales bacterium]|nr:hypothetical protein [Anaerolineales bacterium]
MRLGIQERFSVLKNIFPSLRVILSHPITGTLILIGLLSYMAAKSFVDRQDHLRTTGSFIFLTVGLILILYPRTKFSGFLGFLFLLAFAFFPFYWRFQGLDTDGFTIAGILPQNDANGYFIGTLKILYGEQIPAFAARRPLFSAFLSVILYLSNHNFMIALFILAFLVSLGIYLLGMEVRGFLGVFSAAMTMMIVAYCYIGRFQGKFMTEQLGLPLGALSLALLLRGIKERNLSYFPWAIFILSLALNARAGAFFVLPLLILWFVTLRNVSLPKLALGGIVGTSVALGFIANLWLFYSISVPGSVPFSNFGDTFYGMATGYRGYYSWSYDYPGVESSEAMRISYQIILNSPSKFLYAVFQAYRDYLQPTRFFSFIYLPRPQLPSIAFLLSGFLVVAMVRLIAARRTTLVHMLFAVMIGIFLSIPFVPPIDDGIRAMIVTVPFWALILGLAVADRRTLSSISEEAWTFNLPRINPLLLFSFIMAFAVTLGWLFVWGSARQTIEKFACDVSEYPVALMISPGSYINVVKNNTRLVSWLPDIRREDLRESMREFPKTHNYEYFRRVQTEQSVLVGLNLADAKKDFIWLMVPTKTIETFQGINYFCAAYTGVEELDDANFFVHRDLSRLFQEE